MQPLVLTQQNNRFWRRPLTHMSWHNCQICNEGSKLSEVYLRHVDLALVHELDDCHDVRERCVLQYHHLMRFVEVDEQLFKI